MNGGEENAVAGAIRDDERRKKQEGMLFTLLYYIDTTTCQPSAFMETSRRKYCHGKRFNDQCQVRPRPKVRKPLRSAQAPVKWDAFLATDSTSISFAKIPFFVINVRCHF